MRSMATSLEAMESRRENAPSPPLVEKVEERGNGPNDPPTVPAKTPAVRR